MGIWSEHVVPRIVDKACARADFAEPRRRTLAGVHGDVIEIGFGSGLNLDHYPAGVGRIIAVEPSTIARRLAAERIAGSAISSSSSRSTVRRWRCPTTAPTSLSPRSRCAPSPMSTASCVGWSVSCAPAAHCGSSSTDRRPTPRLPPGSTALTIQ
jgi:hypothetical protein